MDPPPNREVVRVRVVCEVRAKLRAPPGVPGLAPEASAPEFVLPVMSRGCPSSVSRPLARLHPGLCPAVSRP